MSPDAAVSWHPLGGFSKRKFKWFRYGDPDEEERKAKIIARFARLEQARKEGKELENDWFDEYEEKISHVDRDPDGRVFKEGGESEKDLGSAFYLDAPTAGTASAEHNEYRPFGEAFAQRGERNPPRMPRSDRERKANSMPSYSNKQHGASYNQPSSYYNQVFNPSTVPSQKAAYRHNYPAAPSQNAASTADLPDALRLNTTSAIFNPTPNPALPHRPAQAPARATYGQPGYSYYPTEGATPTGPRSKKGKKNAPKGAAPTSKLENRRETRSSRKGSSGSQPMSIPTTSQSQSSPGSQQANKSSKAHSSKGSQQSANNGSSAKARRMKSREKRFQKRKEKKNATASAA